MSLETFKSLCEISGVIVLFLAFLFGAGALLAANRLNAIQDREMSNLKLEVAHANEGAGQANERAATLEREAAGLREQAEHERLARVRLESKVAWRLINPQVRMAIAENLGKFAGIPTLVTYNPNDAEASSFATDLAAALHAANWDVCEPLAMLSLREGPAPFGPNSRPPTGVLVWSTNEDPSRQAATELVQQLTAHGFDAILSPDISGRLTVRSTIRVVVAVEHKPEGAQGEYKLRAQAAGH